MEEIIDRFSDIVELQNTVISDREMELESLAAAGSGCNTSSFIALRQDGFRDDKQLQAAFADYLSKKKKKPLSSYTINDYCSRIRNVWKSFYAEYQAGSLPKELSENVEIIHHGNKFRFASITVQFRERNFFRFANFEYIPLSIFADIVP